MKWLNKKTLTILIGLIVAIIILMSSNLMVLSVFDVSLHMPQVELTDMKQISISKIINFF